MITIKAALDITKNIFCSIIDYGNVFLSSCNIRDIQTLQNHVLRCCHKITDPRDEHVLHLHNIYNVILVGTHRKRQILTGISRNIKKGIIEIANPVRHTRAAIAPTRYLPVPRNELFNKSVFCYGATLWNKLPPHIHLQQERF